MLLGYLRDTMPCSRKRHQRKPHDRTGPIQRGGFFPGQQLAAWPNPHISHRGPLPL